MAAFAVCVRVVVVGPLNALALLVLGLVIYGIAVSCHIACPLLSRESALVTSVAHVSALTAHVRNATHAVFSEWGTSPGPKLESSRLSSVLVNKCIVNFNAHQFFADYAALANYLNSVAFL